MKNDILKYMITIDEEYSDGEDLGINKIAFTAKPAILTKGMAFNSNEPIKLFFADELKYRIAAPMMIPMEIYRSEGEDEYYVQFTTQEIEKLHSKFMRNYSNQDVFNLEHNNAEKVPAYILETILVDSENKINMIKSEYNIDVPLGTSFLVSQVTDKKYYEDLVASGRVGYSIEGFLGLKLSEMKLSENPPYHENCKCKMVNGEIETESDVCDYCQEQAQFEINKKNKETNMNEQLPAGEYTAPDGTIFIIDENGLISKKEDMACAPKEELAIDPSAEVGANPGATASAEPAKIGEEKMADMPGATASAPVEPVKEDMAIGDIAPVVPGEEAVADIESYSKEEVDAKFEELYKLIADMKAEDDAEDITETTEPTMMSAMERFSEFVRFSNK